MENVDPPLAPLNPAQRFQLLLDSACDYAIFFMDTAGRVIEWSSGAENILGFGESEIIGKSGSVIFVPEDRAAGVPELEMATAIRDGQANDERWHLRKDGSRFFAVGRLVGLFDDADRHVGFAKILRDATHRKSLEQALRVSDEQFRATFAQAPLGMALMNLEGRIQQVNAAMCRLTGFSEGELVGREAVTMACPEDRERIASEFEALFRREKPSFVVDKRLERADGSCLWVQNSAAVLRDAEDRPVSIIDLSQDISRLKRSETELEQLVEHRTAALREKTRQLESFCYTVAHDLRAPLRAIAGYAEFLRREQGGKLDAEGREFIDRITGSAARLDRLIQDLLEYTRVQQVALTHEEVDLSVVVDNVVRELTDAGAVVGARLSVHNPLGRVRGDAATLEHVFLNLISNALKFRREDVALEVTIYSEERGPRRRVWVEDNGIGINPQFTARLFGLFERVHDGQKFPGTGIGLAIVGTAMERLGGTRGIEPNPGGGSRFWIELPR